MAKLVYSFGMGEQCSFPGNVAPKTLLGGKGAGLFSMSQMGIPIPPGFTITTEVCQKFYQNNQVLPDGLGEQVKDHLKILEQKLGRQFADAEDPLLVSVRSGAVFSMPGMMDTILNLGLNKKTVKGVAKAFGSSRFAWDTYRRFVHMFGQTVFGIPHSLFQGIIEEVKKTNQIKHDSDLSENLLQEITNRFLATAFQHLSQELPSDPFEQLDLAIKAVLLSWNSDRAKTYRKIHKLPHDAGTAVTVQAMVYGNRGQNSATGVLFTRDPSSGKRGLVGEYLINSQGEDVVAGIRTPKPLSDSYGDSEESLASVMPGTFEELKQIVSRLEKNFQDMQDVEFTIEEGKLWILQTRSGKRTGRAAIQIAMDFCQEGLIQENEALGRVVPDQLNQYLHPTFDPKASPKILARGLPASPGAVSGKVVFSANEAEEKASKGEPVLLVRKETSPEDIHGMYAAQGILTSRGGMTSHAAVVARGMGKCAVVGCSDIEVYSKEKYFITKSGEKISEGSFISLNGSTGEVFHGQIKTVPAELGQRFQKFMQWTDRVRKLKVRANAETLPDCKTARRFGAEGIGLCRTEHMFFDKNRIDVVRQMILANSLAERKSHLEKIETMQLKDFCDIFREMAGLPVTVRLLDPPLHEFLPQGEHAIQNLAARLSLKKEALQKRIQTLQEINPMLGHRGCRIGITFPEIYDMQVKAIITAACQMEKEAGVEIFPEIMIPLIVDAREFEVLETRVRKIAKQIIEEKKSKVSFLVGTMIELPRAALVADEIAKHADFFSFGTNDLTQTTFGLSRDDSAHFLFEYLGKEIFPHDPFVTLDAKGVFELVQIASEKGRRTNPKIKLGICGEHGGDPDSIELLASLNLDYVSCSPFRVPVAKLKAAQIELQSD